MVLGGGCSTDHRICSGHTEYARAVRARGNCKQCLPSTLLPDSYPFSVRCSRFVAADSVSDRLFRRSVFKSCSTDGPRDSLSSTSIWTPSDHVCTVSLHKYRSRGSNSRNDVGACIGTLCSGLARKRSTLILHSANSLRRSRPVLASGNHCGGDVEMWGGCPLRRSVAPRR